MVYGLWLMVYDLWSIVYGRLMVNGLWSMDYRLSTIRLSTMDYRLLETIFVILFFQSVKVPSSIFCRAWRTNQR